MSNTPKSRLQLCHKCDFPLDGWPDETCLECGRHFDIEDPDTFRWYPSHIRLCLECDSLLEEYPNVNCPNCGRVFTHHDPKTFWWDPPLPPRGGGLSIFPLEEADRPKPRRKLCIKCGYVLDRLIDETCPECGRDFDVKKYETFRWEPPVPKKLLHVLSIYIVVQIFPFYFSPYSEFTLLLIHAVIIVGLIAALLSVVTIRNQSYMWHAMTALALLFIFGPITTTILRVLLTGSPYI